MITQIFILKDIKNVMKYMRTYKIKHGPIWKVTDWKHGKGHACAIMNKEDMVIMSLGVHDHYRVLDDDEKIVYNYSTREIKKTIN